MKNKEKVLRYLWNYRFINKATAIAMGIGNLCDVIRNLREDGVEIETVCSEEFGTHYRFVM